MSIYVYLTVIIISSSLRIIDLHSPYCFQNVNRSTKTRIIRNPQQEVTGGKQKDFFVLSQWSEKQPQHIFEHRRITPYM
jgi:hypothetical protein